VTPSIVRSHIAQRLAEMESDGILRDVEANLSLLQVVEDSNVSGRLNCEIPAEVIPGLHIIAGNIRQL
jgi:phage tail sheath gpL-like